MWRLVLLVLTAFCVVSAAAGFLYLAPGGAEAFPLEFLDGTPFDSYLWPGVILLVLVGGPQLLAFVVLVRRRASAAFWAAVAGFALVIWIIAEQLLFGVPNTSPLWPPTALLQIAYAGIGLAELGCVLVLLGLFDREHTRVALGAPHAEDSRRRAL